MRRVRQDKNRMGLSPATFPAFSPKQLFPSSTLPPWSPLATLVIWLLVSVATLTWLSIPWYDEAMYSDPAFRWVMGKGFTSTHWFAQSQTEFFAGYPPLYPLTLGAWLKVFGPSLVAVRAFGVCLMLGAAVLIWRASKRFGITQTVETEVVLLCLILGGYGMLFSYRTGRPDSLHILCAAVSYYLFSLRSSPPRTLAIVFSGLLCTLAGLQIPVFAAALALALALLRDYRALGRFLALGIGMFIGWLGLCLAYQRLGALTGFLNSTVFRFSAVGDRDPTTLGNLFINFGGAKDLSLWGLWIGAGLGMLFWKNQRPFLLRGLCLTASCAVFSSLVGKWPIHYSWSCFIPMAIAWSQVTDRVVERPRKKRILLALFCWALAPILLLSGLAVSQRSLRTSPSHELGKFLRVGERVFCGPEWFYAVWEAGAEPIGGNYLPVMQTEEKRATQVIVAGPDHDHRSLKDFFGGEWQQIAMVGPTATEGRFFTGVLLRSYPPGTVYRRR